MKFVALKNSLKDEVLPAYLIIGEDAFLKQKALELLKNSVVNSNAELNSIFFSTDNLEADRVIDACNTMPFFADKKLVVVTEYEKKNSDSLITKLDEYLNAPNTSTCLVLVGEQDSKYFEPLTKKLEVIDCGKLNTEVLSKIVLSMAKENGKQMSIQAVNTLIDYCNNDLARINIELLKLSSGSASDAIELKDIAGNVNKDLEFQVYELTNALGNKNAESSFVILNNLLENKNTVSAVLASIYKHFRRLFHISVSGLNDKELADKLEVKEYAILKAREQVGKFSPLVLKQINEMCVDIDYKCKIGKMDAENGINFLVLNILNM
ncbi:MAG: DNA polymerase III subunit delta [Spirochaetales bacterium]